MRDVELTEHVAQAGQPLTELRAVDTVDTELVE